MRSRNSGNASFAIIVETRSSAAITMNTPRTRVLIFPRSPLSARVLTSFMNTVANAEAGIAMKVAKFVRGSTAPSSEGLTYLGTSQRPTKALRRSAARQAQKSMSEYHQKSPKRV